MTLGNAVSARRIGALAILAAALAGCATPVTQRIAVDSNARAQEERTQKRLAMQAQAQMDLRLWTVGYGVLKGAAEECGEVVRPSLGMFALSRDRLNEASNKDLMAEALGLDNSVRVMAVYKGGAAEAAGVMKGDVVMPASLSVLAPTGGETREAARARLSHPVGLTVMRDGAPVALTVTPDTVCDYPLTVSPGAEVNAYADGQRIVISKGMMRFAAEDRELALVVGHELGHNTMGHLSKKKQNMAVGAVFDLLAAAYRVNTQNAFMKTGASAYSQDFEAEADYVGLYYLARAGYETQGAADFWRRMAAENPGSIKTNHAATHPATTERFLALEKVGAEVRNKQVSGTPLTPNRVK